MTPQQARIKALQLRSLKPELQSVAIDDLIAQVMATEGAGAPGAGTAGLANLFPVRLSPSSPAPMQAVPLEAPKPTANIVPGVDTGAFQRAQGVRDFTVQPPTAEESATANANRQALVDEVRAGTPAPTVAAVREAAPVAAAAPEAAPKATYRSRFRTELEQKQAQLEQLKATIPPGVETPVELASELRNLSGVVNRLKGLVAAEEGAVVDADRAALLERQTARLAREEELADKANKRAPFDALIAAGTALGSARPGESFTSAFTRGLAAGNESYTGARDARETSRRSIEEKRDAYTLQKIQAIDDARSKAIEMANAGVQMSKEEYALANLKDADVVALGTQEARIDEAKAKADKAKIDAKYAPEVYEAEIDRTRAQAEDARRPPASSGGSGTGALSPNQANIKLGKLDKQMAEAFAAATEASNRGNFAEAERKLGEYAAARAARNSTAALLNIPPISGVPKLIKSYETYVRKRGAHPSGRKLGSGRPAGVGPDWKLETDKKGNKAWVNPSRTDYVEV